MQTTRKGAYMQIGVRRDEYDSTQEHICVYICAKTSEKQGITKRKGSIRQRKIRKGQTLEFREHLWETKEATGSGTTNLKKWMNIAKEGRQKDDWMERKRHGCRQMYVNAHIRTFSLNLSDMLSAYISVYASIMLGTTKKNQPTDQRRI